MKLVVNGADVEVDDRHAKTPLLWVLRDVARPARHEVRLRSRLLRGLHRADRRAQHEVVPDRDRARGRQAGHDRRGRLRPRRRRRPRRLAPRQRRAVRLLPARADAGRGRRCSSPTRPRTTRQIDAVDERQPVPLRHLSAHPGGDPRRRRHARRGRRSRIRSSRRPSSRCARLTPEELADPVHPYIRIREDGTIVAYSSQIEMGQGIHTGLATIVAEELDADFDSVRVVNAANGGGPPTATCTATPTPAARFQITGASNSTKGFWVRYRLAAAQARARLVAAAAERGTCPPTRSSSSAASCATRAASRRRSRELAARAEQLPVPDGVQPKDPSDYTADRARGTAARRRRAEDPRHHPLHDRRQRARDADRGRAAPAAVRRDGRVGRRPGGARRARGDRGRPDRGGRRRRRRDLRRRAARAARAGWSGTTPTPSGAAPPSCWPSTSGCSSRASRPWSPGTTATSTQVLADAPTVDRRDVRAAVSRARHDGAEQRGVPDARGRRARRVGEHRIARVHADVGLRGRRDRQGAGRGARHLRRRIVRPALERRARPDDRGRADRAGARLEAPDQGPVARARRSSRAAATGAMAVHRVRAGSRRGRSADRVSPADRGRSRRR